MKPTPNLGVALLALWLLVACALSASAQHRHVNAGALSQAPGAKLVMVNGVGFNTASRFLARPVPFTNQTYGAIYRTGEITFTGLPTSLDNGGPDDFAAQPGARLALQMVSVDGPKGGSFSFWDSDGFADATEISLTLPVGTANGTNAFILSENDGSPGSDPYGHVHGRKFSVDIPGLYTVGFRLIDVSTNGPGGGPLHPPSDLFLMYFQAGTSIGFFDYSIAGNTVKFGTESGKSYYVEASGELGTAADWKVVAGPIAGTGKLETVGGLASGPGPVFYRLRVTQP